MTRTEPISFNSNALTQSFGHSQPCANPFCHGGMVVKSPRAKHGRYCSDRCRMDGYVLRRAKAMMNEVGIVEFNRILEEL
jgi:hypothetical protein